MYNVRVDQLKFYNYCDINVLNTYNMSENSIYNNILSIVSFMYNWFN